MDNIIKLNAEQQIVTAALMVPDETHLQGDSISRLRKNSNNVIASEAKQSRPF